MIVVCPACQARFQYDEQRFEGAPKKRFKCPKCGHIFEVANPGLTSPVPDATTALPDLALPPAPLTTALKSPYIDAAPAPPPAPAPMPMDGGIVGRTTQRSDREAMLAAAGLGKDAMPANFLFSLAIVAGPQASTVHPLEKPFNVIGRDEGDVISRDPEVSRRHAGIEIRRDGTVWLSDLQSTNGTFVGGQRLDGAMQLGHQDEFTCGNSTFMLVVRDLNEFQMH